MATKFLVKNTANQEGIYRSEGKEQVLKPREQVILSFPPEFHSVELKVIQVNR